jgi:hypothetical protein
VTLRRCTIALIAATALAGITMPAAAQITVDAPPPLAGTARRIQALDLQPLADALRRAGLELPTQLQITLVPGNDLRAQATPDWIVGLASGRDRIVIFPDRVGGYPYGSLEAVVRHEIAHLALNARADDRPLPRWFHEGVAVSLESGWGVGGQLRLVLATLQNPGIGDLTQLFASDAQSEAALAYLLATVLVDDLVRRHGPQVPGAIAARVATGVPFDRAFALETGISPEAAATRAWAGYVRWIRWIPAVTSPSAIWSVIMTLAFVVFAVQLRRRHLRRRRWDMEDQGLDIDLTRRKIGRTE